MTAESRRPLVEILYFDGCPSHEGARSLVKGVGDELGIEPEVRLVNVADPETAERERFLGSPTIRVNGRDVEPGADDRTDFAYSCRVYRSDAASTGQPDAKWLRDALSRAQAFRPEPSGSDPLNRRPLADVLANERKRSCK